MLIGAAHGVGQCSRLRNGAVVMDAMKCHVCGAQSTIAHAPHCSFRGLPEYKRIAELEAQRNQLLRDAATKCKRCDEFKTLKRAEQAESALNRLGGSPPPGTVTFAQLSAVQEECIEKLKRERDEAREDARAARHERVVREVDRL